MAESARERANQRSYSVAHARVATNEGEDLPSTTQQKTTTTTQHIYIYIYIQGGVDRIESQAANPTTNHNHPTWYPLTQQQRLSCWRTRERGAEN